MSIKPKRACQPRGSSFFGFFSSTFLPTEAPLPQSNACRPHIKSLTSYTIGLFFSTRPSLNPINDVTNKKQPPFSARIRLKREVSAINLLHELPKTHRTLLPTRPNRDRGHFQGSQVPRVWQ